MKKRLGDIAFGCLVAMLKALARLPLGVLYVLADMLYVLIYHVVRYRRAMVRKNLTICFPDKAPNEIRAIERRFYHNFADYVVETVKLLHISDQEMSQRMVFENLDVISQLMDQGQSIVAYFAHIGNWEWAPSITLSCPDQVSAGDLFAQIYRPLRNERFDRLMLKIRSRFGTQSIPKKLALRTLLTARRDGIVSITGFMSDQKPSHGDAVHVLSFMGRPTAVITGTETLGRRLGMAAVYWDMSKPKRGHYVITVKLLARSIADTQPMAVTDAYFKMLEKTLCRQPELWLWTHNRWKNPVTQPKHNDD